METAISTDAPNDTKLLGNFLSGMETSFALTELTPRSCLGNFLSGMETWRRVSPIRASSRPWKLP